jgi:hypothetical protein
MFMTNSEYLEILEQGVSVWNNWRLSKSNKKPDSDSEKTNKLDCLPIDLRGADLRKMKLNGVNFSDVNLRHADLSGAKLKSAKFYRADLFKADFIGAELIEADLSESYARRVLFNDADLRNANLKRVDFHNADLSDADLRNADLSEADLTDANLSRADIENSQFNHCTIGWSTFGNVDLSLSTGLETIKHIGPSTIGVDTIYQSKGSIPKIFLRGVGAPDNFIEYMGSLTGKGFEYFSCFISYSSKDKEFAERLYADLRNRDVNCWFAPEDMKIGDKIRQRIDISIRIHNKLLLILSENSLSSEWIEDEVEAAYELERSKNKAVLCPIRIDDFIFDTCQAWAAKLRRARNIGDFTKWRNDDYYKKALERLVRDLKTNV